MSKVYVQEKRVRMIYSRDELCIVGERVELVSIYLISDCDCDCVMTSVTGDRTTCLVPQMVEGVRRYD